MSIVDNNVSHSMNGVFQENSVHSTTKIQKDREYVKDEEPFHQLEEVNTKIVTTNDDYLEDTQPRLALVIPRTSDRGINGTDEESTDIAMIKTSQLPAREKKENAENGVGTKEISVAIPEGTHKLQHENVKIEEYEHTKDAERHIEPDFSEEKEEHRAQTEHTQSADEKIGKRSVAEQKTLSLNEPDTEAKHRQDESFIIQEDLSHGVTIDAIGLMRKSNKRTILLNDISLSIPSGSFVALVGGSGTGKSTLMNALNGRHSVQKGKVLYNGYDYYRHLSTFSKELGYVPQDDIVHADLTVERALYYAARLRLPRHFSSAQIWQRINEVLEDVEIQDRRHLLISKLSGGQRKRVSIALELLDRPGIFFLDEPTSGLDPGLDRKMMLLLRKLADKGQTIVLVTHATANIHVCDYICFLAQGGRLAYFGPPAGAQKYFNTSDFAEMYSLLEPRPDFPDAPEMAMRRFKASSEYEQYVKAPLEERKALTSIPRAKLPRARHAQRCGPLKQFSILSERYLERIKNDPGNLLILLLQAPIIALFLISLVKYEIGADTFNKARISRCPTTKEIVNPVGVPDRVGPGRPSFSFSCNRVLDFLKHNPQGKIYASKRGGAEHALQDFMEVGSGDDAQKVLFIITFTAVLFGSVNAAREIVKEIAIYKRERAVNLGILPYVFSKLGVLSLLCLVQSAILVGIVHVFDPFDQGKGIFFPVFLEIYITVALTALASLMMGLAISALAPSTDRAMSFIPIILIPQVIFSGTVFPFKNWVTQYIAMTFIARWSIGSLGSTVGLHNAMLGGDKLLGDNEIYHGLLFSTYSQANAQHHLLLMWLALALMGLFFFVLTSVALKLKDRR